MNILNQSQGENWTLANGDCIEVLNSLPENSIHLSIFSPPYAPCPLPLVVLRRAHAT